MEFTNYDLQTNGELSALQFTTNNADTFNCVSLADALKKNFIEIKEVSESADVNNLYVLNKSDHYVFMMDGDILQGAKQNRVLNTSVLLAPKSKGIIPVSCVEQGRWSFVSDKFTHSDYSAPTMMRAKKSLKVRDSLRESNKHESDQGEVWEDVHGFAKSFNVNSKTSNLSDIYNEKQKSFDDLAERFTSDPMANGVAIFTRKKLLSIDIFNRKDLHTSYFPKLLKGAAFEAINLKSSDEKPSKDEAYFKTISLLDKIDSLEFIIHKGVGVGDEKRYQSDLVSGFELNYEKNLIHLSAINLENGK